MNTPSARLDIPFRASRSRAPFPTIATFVLLALNVLVFILMIASGGPRNVEVLLDFGASYGPYFRSGEYWRLVTPMFVHLSWAHLIGNMVVLCLLGLFLEPLYGYGRFSLIYVIAGMGGSLLSMEASPHIGAGASGAIFGIAGAMLVTGLVHPEAVPRRWKSVFGVGIAVLIAVNLVYDRFSGHVDNWAHVGGLATGVLMALLIPPPRYSAISRRPLQPVLVVPLVLVVAGFGAAFTHAQKTHEVTALLRDSITLQSRGKADRARALLEQARRLEPKDVRVREAWGLVYLQEHKYSQASHEFTACLRANPFDTLAALSLSAAYESQNEASKARDVLEQFSRRVTGSADVLAALGRVCVQLKLYPEAIERYEQALKIVPNAALTQNNLAWLYATCSDPRYRNPGKALSHALRAAELTQAKQPEILDTLAAAYNANGQFELAVRAEERALALDPGNAGFQQSLVHYRILAGK
ncbi:MAG: rhomboid family intramembrane serine protease [Terriglobia bacterium]